MGALSRPASSTLEVDMKRRGGARMRGWRARARRAAIAAIEDMVAAGSAWMGWEVENEVVWENREHRMMFPVM